ncbi:hypothetical protein OG994_25960 [Micromonospora globbae]|uniref:Bacterial transcriptional activator domain-containing protein n=1 Tax=Micromonospora globbae TaxID=1894969 RepID=A0ABZ1S4K7_9ACTN|nr:hypothetical protein [Micromonospora globbae]
MVGRPVVDPHHSPRSTQARRAAASDDPGRYTDSWGSVGVRWPRQLMSLLVVLALLAGPPVVLLSLIGPPISGWPTGEHLRAWVQQPLTEQTVTAALTITAWLLWLVLAYTVTVRTLTRIRATARWLARLPLPTPLQATATGMAGAAVLGAGANAVTVPAPPLPAPVGTLDSPGGTGAAKHDGRAQRYDGIAVHGGWLPREVAEQVTAAAALVWLRRRRDYQPHPPGRLGREDPELAPLPSTAAAVQAALADAPAPLAEMAPAAGIPALAGVPGSGVGITGPGALAVGRGLLVTVLLAGQRHPTACLVTTRAALTRLLGPHMEPLVDRLPQLAVVDTVDEAAHLVVSAAPPDRARGESETREGRTAVTAQAPFVLIVEDDCGQRDVTPLVEAAVTRRGRVVMLGRWPAGPTWHADPAGHLHDPRRPDWSGPRWCVLDQVAATDLLAVIAHTQTPPGPAGPDGASPQSATPTRRVPRQATRHHPLPQAAAGRRLELRVLGEPTLLIDGHPVAVRRSAAVQVLVYLAVHPDGADTRQLIGAIWPGVPRQSLAGRLYTTLSELRGVVRDACGLNLLDHADDRYRLNPAHIQVDLWRLHDAIQHAATAVTNTPIAWQAVIDAYPDELATGRTWPWLDPIRETIRRHVLGAHVALADTAIDKQRALTLLQAAIRIDPYNTDLHTRTVNVLTALGEHHAAHELREGYIRRLTAAGLHPGDQVGSAATNMSGPPVAKRMPTVRG